IYNRTGEDVDLSNYYIGTIVNGGTDVENSQVLTGILGDYQTLCFYNDADFDSTFRLKGNINITWTSATWNGDDAIYLLKGGITKDFIIDAIGDMPPVTDPGTEFVNNGVGTTNATLVRKSSVVSPTTVWLGLEWEDIAPGTYSDWGTHTMTCNTDVVNLESINNFEIEVYPNPANNKFTININGSINNIKSLKIINLLGETLKIETMNLSLILNHSIDFNYSTGVYFILLETIEKIYTKKVIISNN
ncbi:MAG: hypothetical protein A2046_06440, partial [Bacteroidetes bacterium GWA2_30_7]